jgi:restriction system protein
MPIPDYQSLMLPLLKVAADGKVHTKRDATQELSQRFELTEEECKELLPSGNQAVFDNRFGWARTYLKKAVLIQYPQRGHFQITDRGKSVLAKNPPVINVAFLRQFPEFLEFHGQKTIGDPEPPESPESLSETPEELVASEFFERLVVRLLIAMGYGGSLVDAGKAIGKSGDGGVDGVIKEDKLGLDLIYLQAKRWDSASVGRPEIQKFVGALHGKRARKGIFLTTSTFTKDAHEYAEGLETKVILIDGVQLAELMFDYGVGVQTESTYLVKRMDSDFFEDEDGADTAAEAAAK